MNKKGFTLIELLAILIILAIIATITIPVVTSIINDSKESSGRKSVELYGRSIENAIKSYMASNDGKVPSGSYYSKGKLLYLKCNDSETDIDIDYKGTDLYCDDVIISQDGEVYIEGCKVNNKYVYNKDNKDYYTYGEISKPKSFNEDDWNTIIANVQLGNIDKYKVGDTKEIKLTGELAGTYTVRIANTSTPEECKDEDFSQTACGFVIEFVDVIFQKSIHVSSENDQPGSNIGGMMAGKTYIPEVFDDIYSSLPNSLQSSILNTKVISGHGNGETANVETQQKLYLLAPKEIFGTHDVSISPDTLTETRQLQYYKDNNVSLSNKTLAIKKFNGNAKEYWLRSAYSNNNVSYYSVGESGNVYFKSPNNTLGIAPAFRIG